MSTVENEYSAEHRFEDAGYRGLFGFIDSSLIQAGFCQSTGKIEQGIIRSL